MKKTRRTLEEKQAILAALEPLRGTHGAQAKYLKTISVSQCNICDWRRAGINPASTTSNGAKSAAPLATAPVQGKTLKEAIAELRRYIAEAEYAVVVMEELDSPDA